MRRTFIFSTRHDRLLLTLAPKLGISRKEAVQRGLELLEAQEVARELAMKGRVSNGHH